MNAQASVTYTGGNSDHAIGLKIEGKSIEIKKDFYAEGGKGKSSYGVLQSFGSVWNEGTLIAIGGSNLSAHGYLYLGLGFSNSHRGTIYAQGGSGEEASGFRLEGLSYATELKNEGVIEARGGSSNQASGLDQDSVSLLINDGSITAIGGKEYYACGYEQGALSTLINSKYGKIKAIGGIHRVAHGFDQSGTMLNEGEIVATGFISIGSDEAVGAYGMFQGYDGVLRNRGSISAIGGSATLDSTLLKMTKEPINAFGFYQCGTLINEGTLDVQGGNIDCSYGHYQTGVLINQGKINVKDGTQRGIYGFNSEPWSRLINKGIINLVSTLPLNALNALGSIVQTGAGGESTISGNLISFVDYDSTGIIAVAPFLSKNISGGEVLITDADLSKESQEVVREAIYKAGVSRFVRISFGGVGNKTIAKKSFFSFLKN